LKHEQARYWKNRSPQPGNLPPGETDWKKVMAMIEQEILAGALAGPDHNR
jgi:hypothetical protein